MFRNAHRLHTLLLLAGAASLLAALPGMAAAHGGGGFGGFGGGHGGFGGGHGGFGGGHGGFGGYSYHGGFGAYHYGYYGGGGGNLSPYGYPYSSYPSYFGGGYFSGEDLPLTYSGLSGLIGPEDAVASTPQQTDTTAHVTVRLPADAELWFNGKKTVTAGPRREFASPNLKPGHTYSYDVRAHWKEKGHEVTQTVTIDVSAGTQVPVQFPRPATAQARR